MTLLSVHVSLSVCHPNFEAHEAYNTLLFMCLCISVSPLIFIIYAAQL
jgi:hypothetical protein